MRAEFRLLGDVEASVEGRELDIGHARQRTVLAALLIDVGRVVSVDQLVSRVWGQTPPQRARGTLHSYLSRLRRVLSPDVLGETACAPGETAAPEDSPGARPPLLARRLGGYVLSVDPLTVDLHRFRQLLARARERVKRGERANGPDDAGAAALIREALDLWRGDEALAGLDTSWTDSLREGLARERHAAELDLTDVRLRLGEHADLLHDLAGRVTAHPLDERMAGQYILALHRSGRRGDALAHFQVVRRTLAEELGVDPSAELAALQGRILCADVGTGGSSALALGAGAGAGAGTDTTEIRLDTLRVDTVHVAHLAVAESDASAVRPAQLPTAVSDFTGRDAHVVELTGRLAARAPAVAIAGIGGVGKTTLALHVAHAVREHFPDGQLYVDLYGGTSEPADSEAVLGAFLRALGVKEAAVPDGKEERAALYRSLLAGRHVLVLLDNARDAAQIRPLLPGTAGCTALVTSRARLVGLESAPLVDLDVMDSHEAIDLFTRIVGEARVTEERPAALEVVRACGLLPLAIRIAASRLVSRRAWTVAVLAAKLADERRRLDELQAGDLAVTATFELGYGQLEAEQARAFRLLGLVEGPDISLAAAAALLDREEHRAEDVLESLVDMSLLESAAPGRYRFHDLIRLYARGRARDPASEDSTAALIRLLDFYRATAARVFAYEYPGDRGVDHLDSHVDSHAGSHVADPTDGQQEACRRRAARPGGLEFGSREASLDWLVAEAECLLACANQLAGAGEPRRAADLLVAVKQLADRGDYASRFEQCAQSVRDAAGRAGDPRAEARARAMLTHLYTVVGRFSRAEQEAREVARLGRAAGDVLSIAYAANDQGIVAQYLGRYEEAEAFLEEAIDAFHKDGNRPSEASALCNLSRNQMELGRYESAVSLAERGLAIYRDMGSTFRMGNALYTLGCALARSGRTEEGLEELARALLSFRESRQPLWEGVTAFRMAEAHLAAGRPDKVVEHAELALELRCIGGEWRRGTVLVVLGRAYNVLGRKSEAAARWREALEIFERRGTKESAEVRALLAER